MHELSYVEQIIKTVTHHANVHRAKRINRITLQIHSHSGIEPRSFRFYWNTLTKGELLHDSKLVFLRKQSKTTCLACQRVFIPEKKDDELIRCPFCGSIKTVISENNEILIKSIEIQT